MEDRPEWIKESVWMLGPGFNPQRWDDRQHCEEERVVAGGLETLRAFGTHSGSGEAHFALVFLDAPILKACNIVDLPGFDNDTEDTEKAKANPAGADIAIYVANHVGFFTGADLIRLGQIIRGLPLFENVSKDFPTLGNLLIVATHAAPAVVSDDTLNEILDKACKRAWRHLGEVLSDRGYNCGRVVKEEDLRARCFTFYAETPARRQRLENDLKVLFVNHVGKVWHKRADLEIVAFKEKSKGILIGLIDSYRKMLEDIQAARDDLKRAQEEEPSRREKVANHRKRVLESIYGYEKEAISALDANYRQTVDASNVEKIIKEKFPEKKDAQENAAAFVFEQVQQGVNLSVANLSDRLTIDINNFLGKYQGTSLSSSGKFSSQSVPFNAEGAFIGGLAGVVGVGALAAWAATLGNLGAYIIAAKAVSLLAALGIGISGGTAAVMGLMAAIGGPVTIAVGIVASLCVLGWSLFGPSWQERLAKKIVSEFYKRGIRGQFESQIEQFWQQTRDAFEKGADNVEIKYQAYLQDLIRIASDQFGDLAELRKRLKDVEVARDFFGGIPWRGVP
jgi:hypothetical protein